MRNGALKNLRERKRKGFTLVELLIVIIIIGILAGAMLLVAGSGTDKAEATKIVSDLRSLKSAALMYYADHNAWPIGTSGDIQANLGKYMDRKVDAAVYKLNDDGSGVGRNPLPTGGVREKLKDMAKEAGLYTQNISSDVEYAGGEQAWMKVH